MNTIEYDEWRWDRIYTRASMSGGPERVQVGQHDPKFRRRPVGFTADVTAETDPIVWDGDDS